MFNSDFWYCTRRSLKWGIDDTFGRFNRRFDKFFPRFCASYYDEKYIVVAEDSIYRYTGTFPSMFHKVIGRRFVSGYYYAMNLVQKRLHDWLLECWKKLYGDSSFDRCDIFQPGESFLSCTVDNREEDKYLSLGVCTNRNINTKDEEYWKVIEGVDENDKEKYAALGAELLDVQSYLKSKILESRAKP